MEFIDPATQPGERVVLAGLYPLLSVSSSYDMSGSSAVLKAECLVQDVCTVPGSMVIESPALQKLVLDNQELLSSGILVLDLRNSAKSFSDLIQQKYANSASDDMRKTAELLDQTCSRVLHYSAEVTSDAYKNHMTGYLSRLMDISQTGLEKKAIAKLIETIRRQKSYLRYRDAAELKTNISRLDERISAAARFFYCACGGEVLHATVQVPQDLYAVVHLGSSVSQINPSAITAATDLGVAHNAILEHFAIQQAALRRLKLKDILELRADGATRRTVSRLRNIVSEVHSKFEADGQISRQDL